MSKESRYYERIRIPEDQLLPCEGVQPALNGHISVLGLGGMFIRTRDVYPVGTKLDIRIHTSEGVVETDCVVRDVEPGGMGVEFVKLRGPHEQTVREILTRVKG